MTDDETNLKEIHSSITPCILIYQGVDHCIKVCYVNLLVLFVF